MSLDEFIQVLDRAYAALPVLVGEEMEVVAGDGLVLVDRRIHREGKDSKGSAFPDYTPAYKKKKQEAGRYTGKVDLQLTNEMWKNIGIVEKSSTNDTSTVTLGGKDQFTRDKMSGNNIKRRDWFSLSDEEVDILRKDSAERMGVKLNDLFP